MKDIILLLTGKVINGLFGLLLFHVIRGALIPTAYIDFSNCLAILTLIATFSGGAIGGLMLKRAFNSIENGNIIIYWIIFFLFLSIIVVEVSIVSNNFPAIYRIQAYAYLISNLFASIILIDFQIKKKFLMMAFTDAFRIIIPILLLLGCHQLFHLQHFNVGQVLWFLVIANLYGVGYFLYTIKWDHHAMKDLSYLKENWKSDLLYSFWFSSFNALVQLLVTVDRKVIASTHSALLASKIAYTADQITRVANGVIFPINTKVSSELGLFIRDKKVKEFNSALMKGALLSLAFGLFLIGMLLLANKIAPIYGIKPNIDATYAVVYAVGTTLYLTSIILQKRFDYTKYKSAPTFFLSIGFLIGYTLVKYVPGYTYGLYLATTLMFSLLIVLASFTAKNRVEMDR
jgi:O-antigen/teichoic acid export membrane protein